MPDDKKMIAQKTAMEGEVIATVGSPEFIGAFLERPLDAIRNVAEGVFGVAEVGKWGAAKAVTRTLLAACSGNGVDQFAHEWRILKEKGDLQSDEEIATHPFAMKSLIDLLQIIDSNPEKERLKAVKALFFRMISKNKEDKEEILIYELFEISKKLSASELIVLKAIQRLAPILEEEAEQSTNQNPSMTPTMWNKRVAEESGYKVLSLIREKAGRLAELGLVPEDSIKGPVKHPKQYTLTELGNMLCQILSNYTELFDEA